MSQPKTKVKEFRQTPEGTPEEPKQEFAFSVEEKEFLMSRAAIVDFANTMIEDAQRVMQAYVSVEVCRNRLGVDPIADRVTFNLTEGKLWTFEPSPTAKKNDSIFDINKIAPANGK